MYYPTLFNRLSLAMDHSDSELDSHHPEPETELDDDNSYFTAQLSKDIKEIRDKIISVKKTVTKGDKKQKKEIQNELGALEVVLSMKQEELKRLKISPHVPTPKIDSNDEDRINKARLKKERRKEEKAAEWEANRQAALAEIASRPDLALEESKSFTHQLSEKGFRIVEIAADGHCLFSSIGCQLDPPRDHWELRYLAAKYLLNHRSEYECFIEFESISTETEVATDKFEEYCRKIESTGMWGGQIELEALSRALNVTIIVLQSEGPELIFNPSDDKNQQVIYLSFHRYAFSLGEHYNALVRID